MFPPYILHIWWEGPARRRSYRCKEASRITPPPHRGHGGLLQAAGFERCRAPRHQVAGALRQGAPVRSSSAKRRIQVGRLSARSWSFFLSFSFFFQKFTVTKHNVIIGELCIQLFFFYISFDFFFLAQVIYISRGGGTCTCFQLRMHGTSPSCRSCRRQPLKWKYGTGRHGLLFLKKR